MRWADVYVCMLADGVALRNRCPQGQADPRAAIAGVDAGVTDPRAAIWLLRWLSLSPVGDDEQGLALDAMGRRLRSPRLPGVDVPGHAMRWADVYVSMLADADALPNLSPKAQAQLAPSNTLGAPGTLGSDT